MKKVYLKKRLVIRKKTISNFNVKAVKGGTNTSPVNCAPSAHFACTFGECFTLGPGCTTTGWQVC